MACWCLQGDAANTGLQATANGNAHVQQQIILSSNGMTVQIVRVVEIGNPRQLNLDKQLKQLGKELLPDHVQVGKDAAKDGNKVIPAPSTDDPVKSNDEPVTPKVPGEPQQAAENAAVPKEGLPPVGNDEGEITHKVIQEKVIPVTLTPKAEDVPEHRERRDVRGFEDDNQPPTGDQQGIINDQMQPIGDQPPRDGQRVRGGEQQAGQEQKRPRKLPPTSIFRHLGPSRSRYTIPHDEF